MGNSLREVKIRINSTKNTAQITKAMYMVSSSKVKRSEKNFKAYRDYLSRLVSVSQNILAAIEDSTHPMLVKRDVKKRLYLLITSDRGLAGGYNNNLFKALEERILNDESDVENVFAAIGKRGYAYLKKKNYPLIHEKSVHIRDDVDIFDIKDLADKINNLYLDEVFDELVIVYNHYINSIKSEIKFEKLLPVQELKAEKNPIDYVFESGVEETIKMVLPMLIVHTIYGIILDAKTSEHSARMQAMKSATDNANEVIDRLQLLYNRARQNAITLELIDIVNGANAIK